MVSKYRSFIVGVVGVVLAATSVCACGDQSKVADPFPPFSLDTASVNTPTPPTTNILSNVHVGTETYDPTLAKIELGWAADRSGLTTETYIANELTPYSTHRVTAKEVTTFQGLACSGPADQASNYLTSVMNAPAPSGIAAANDALNSVLINCKGTGRNGALTATETTYFNQLSNYVARYLLTSKPPAQSKVLITLPPPAPSAASNDLYKAVCSGAGAGATAMGWYSELKESKGGLLGIAIIAAAVSYCPDLLKSVLQG